MAGFLFSWWGDHKILNYIHLIYYYIRPVDLLSQETKYLFMSLLLGLRLLLSGNDDMRIFEWIWTTWLYMSHHQTFYYMIKYRPSVSWSRTTRWFRIYLTLGTLSKFYMYYIHLAKISYSFWPRKIKHFFLIVL